MARETRRSYWMLLALLFVLPAGLAVGEELPEKLLKYHTVLRKRPQPGYLFDRFYNAWLDEASVDVSMRTTEVLSSEGKSPQRTSMAPCTPC